MTELYIKVNKAVAVFLCKLRPTEPIQLGLGIWLTSGKAVALAKIFLDSPDFMTRIPFPVPLAIFHRIRGDGLAKDWVSASRLTGRVEVRTVRIIASLPHPIPSHWTFPAVAGAIF